MQQDNGVSTRTLIWAVAALVAAIAVATVVNVIITRPHTFTVEFAVQNRGDAEVQYGFGDATVTESVDCYGADLCSKTFTVKLTGNGAAPLAKLTMVGRQSSYEAPTDVLCVIRVNGVDIARGTGLTGCDLSAFVGTVDKA